MNWAKGYAHNLKAMGAPVAPWRDLRLINSLIKCSRRMFPEDFRHGIGPVQAYERNGAEVALSELRFPSLAESVHLL